MSSLLLQTGAPLRGNQGPLITLLFFSGKRLAMRRIGPEQVENDEIRQSGIPALC
jgi:hypothetical protein